MSVETERIDVFFQGESIEIKEGMVKDKGVKNTQVIAKWEGRQASEKAAKILKMCVSRKSRVGEAGFRERAGQLCRLGWGWGSKAADLVTKSEKTTAALEKWKANL